MYDLHLELADLLQRKEQNIPGDVDRIKEKIKGIADRLQQDSTVDTYLDAAFAYYVAGYYVRASRLIFQEDVSESIHQAQRWLALILSKHFTTIEEQIQAIITDDRYSDTQLQEEVRLHGLSDFDALNRILVRKIAETLGTFVRFVCCGDETCLDRIRSNLGMCQRLTCKANEAQWWWWIECIKFVIAEFVENCLWQQLKPMRQEIGADQMVSRYIIANYERSNPVVELWRTQVESLDKVNDPENRSFCLAIPTSGGKTRVAELAILRFFIDYSDDPVGKCVYIAPLRKLANEVEQTLSPVFSTATSNPRVVSSFYGGQELDPLDQQELTSARVLIVTPEKLDAMLRHNRDLLAQIRLVIADEGHIIGDDNLRGYRYRMLLERLIYALKIKQVSTESKKPRLLLISGVLPNASEFAELITGDRSNVVCINWRPLDEPLKDWWKWDGKQLKSSNNVVSPPSLSSLPACNGPNKFETVVARTAFIRAMNSPTMVFSASKRAIESRTLLALLECLLDQYPLLTDEPLSPTLIRRDGFEKYYLLLERGVAIHHRDLPANLKNETETRIYDGRVRLLFASSTLAQGVNIPFNTVLVYRLRHGNEEIQDTTFWNVVGRVGRPIVSRVRGSNNLHPPEVVFLVNQSSDATKEDKIDFSISKRLIGREKQYRIASPFLQFLNQLRQIWEQNTGQSVAELVYDLAEKPDLKWVTDSKIKDKLRLLDEHLMALIEETNADDWLQDISKEVIDLLVGATSIEPKDLDFIKEAVQARAIFIAKHTPKQLRRQDYLLGLPLKDCESIRDNKDKLFNWYQGSADIFARKLDSGIDALVELLNFVSSLSICPKKWRSGHVERLPMFDLLDKYTIARGAFFKSWILGETIEVVTQKFKQLYPDADFDEYREEMFESNVAWGLSAVCRLLNELTQEHWLFLTKDLEFLPSLVKYGVSGKLACFLVKLKIPREAAVQIAELHIKKMEPNEDVIDDSALLTFKYTEQVISSLTKDEIGSLQVSEATVKRIKEIKRRNTDKIALG